MRDRKTWRICYDDDSITECVRANKPTRFAKADSNLLASPEKSFTIKQVEKTPTNKKQN